MNTISKETQFLAVEKELNAKGLTLDTIDKTRPWGGFFVINEALAQKFSDLFFEGLDVQTLKISGKLSPKILVLAPSKRLSWQYHRRRAEIWRVIQGEVGVITSDTDEEGSLKTLRQGEVIKLERGERHRLVGLDDWAVIAEIWQHTDAQRPSDEADIIRVRDDFGR